MKEFDVEALKEEYTLKPEKEALVEAKKLDRACKLPVYIFTYVLGIISSLLLGIGMCLCMKVIGDGSILVSIIGIIVGLVGILGISINYPIYAHILKRRKEKYSSLILLALNKE